MTEAIERLLDYIFDDLRKHRVFAITDVQNARAIALLERVGLRREGTFIDSVWFKRHWASEHLYALLHHEWLPDSEEEPPPAV
jgi:RimJ/RimL family protein N-acetyltransferase